MLNRQARIPVEVAKRVLAAASDGLAGVVVGDAPASSAGLNDPAANDAAVAQAMTELLPLGSVIQVTGADDVASGLIGLGVMPSASSAAGWQKHHRGQTRHDTAQSRRAE